MNAIFPKSFDNTYRGSWVAVWLLTPVLLLKLFMAVNVMGLNPLVSIRDIIVNADGIPLDSFSNEAQEITIFMFASWGLGLFLLCSVAIAALLRYRAMIPFAIFLLTVEQVGRKALAAANFAKDGAADAGLSIGVVINGAFSIALILAFVFSIIPRREKKSD